MSEKIMVYHNTWGAKQIDSNKLPAYQKNGYTVTPEVQEQIEAELESKLESRIEEEEETEEPKKRGRSSSSYSISKD